MEGIKGKSVEVKSPIEYGMALAAFIIAGADVWPWHKGYKELDKEDGEEHHTYAWEDCGFLKMAGVLESMSGDFKSSLELVHAVRRKVKPSSNINNTINLNIQVADMHEFQSLTQALLDNVDDLPAPVMEALEAFINKPDAE